ncbi:MAG TPA: rRNA maturation RNase YbeY [Candidatus Goldiibacteriota bacterium]|nr:rRNA maturation RNase YbeY [Candidatus Goldiibacteriota bacterium]
MKKTDNLPFIKIFFQKKFKIRYNLKNFVEKILEKENKTDVYINLIFVDDEKIKQINTDFRMKKSATDVISFGYNEKKQTGGDVFISVETAKINAKIYDLSFEEEMLRLVAHGVLHVLGYDHTDVFNKTEEMKKKQEKYVSLFLKER